jgi:hypothetical protein
VLDYERVFNLWSGSMCDYSLHTVASRPAKAGDLLVTTSFSGFYDIRGFCSKNEPSVAVCLMPGTELAFRTIPSRHRVLTPLVWLGVYRHIDSKLARFRQVSFDDQIHDALEFSNGEVELVTALRRGLEATVLQLPATAGGDHTATKHNSVVLQTEAVW